MRSGCRWSRCRRASADMRPLSFILLAVLAVPAARAGGEPLAATFPGPAVKLEFQPMGKLVQSLAGGYRADMVIVTSEVLPQLERDGRVAAGGGRPDRPV